MKLPYKHKLKYKVGNADFYHYGTAKEADISAEVIIVPGEMIDNHFQNKTSLPLIGGACHKNHKDYKTFNPNIPELKGKNLIFIRDEAFELANKDEFGALVQHEFGHIWYEDTGQAESPYDHQEELAHTFVENLDDLHNLFKKWAIHCNKKCDKCQSDMKIDEKTVPNHWFIWCPKCGNWLGDGDWNPFFLDNLVRKRLGLKLKVPDKKYAPIMPREANIALDYMIREAKQFSKLG